VNAYPASRAEYLHRLFPDEFLQDGCTEQIMDLRKVYGGTPVGQDSRCDSCVYARIIRGYAESEKITLCDRILEVIRIPFKVMECSDYVDKRLPCIEDMEEMAWLLRSKSAGRRAGFVGAGAQEEPRPGNESGDQMPVEGPSEVPAQEPELAPAARTTSKNVSK